MEQDDYSDTSDYEEEEDFETATVDDIEYRLFSKTSHAILSKHGKKDQSLVVPVSITHDDKEYKVTGIGPRALRDSKIKNLSFADGSAVEKLKRDSLYCHTLEEVTLPENLLMLERGWCNFTMKLQKINVPESNNNFVVDKDTDALYSSNMAVIFFAPRKIRSFVLPNSVSTISAYAFEQCRRLKKFEFQEGSNLKRIDPWAFSHSGIKTITFPDSLETISYDAFFHSHKLQEIIFNAESNLKEILISAFKDTYLQEVHLPSSCKKIAIAAFQKCPKLSLVKFESGDYITVWRDAFKDTNNDFKVQVYEGVDIKGTGANQLNVERLSPNISGPEDAE